MLSVVLGGAALIFFAAWGSSAPTPENLRPPKKAQVSRPTPTPATLRLWIFDQATKEVLANTPVSIGRHFLTTDTSGSAASFGLSPGGVDITARARGYAIHTETLFLESGENTAAIHLKTIALNEASEGVGFGRKAYLTIDDGPSSRWTPKVLDVLRREKVPATFFLVGRRATRQPDLVRRIYLEGHEVGNHTYSHSYRELYGGSSQNLLDSLSRNGEILASILGFSPSIWRPPGGARGNLRSDWESRVRASGYVTVLWNVSSGDGSTQTTSRQMVKNTIDYLDRLGPKDNAIILMHDIRAPIVTALPKIIAETRRRGFQFAGVEDKTRVRDLISGR